MFPRKAGREPGNESSFVESQRQWGTVREHYAPIMFQYEPPRNRTSPAAGLWHYNGRLVIDYWLRPLQDFQEIPHVLSSEYEGEFMESAQRRNKSIKHADFRQRMYASFPNHFFLIPRLQHTFLLLCASSNLH